MLTANKFAVSWRYREGDRTVRRALYHATPAPCIEAARIIAGNPYVSEIEVLEVDTGKAIVWVSGIGKVLCDGQT